MDLGLTVTVGQFIEECKRDLQHHDPIKPRYVAMFKNMIMRMDEVLESDKTLAHKFKKSVKGLHSAASGYVTNEFAYAENMEKLGSVALSREAETGIGTAFLKLSVITKDLANHRKTMCENMNNMVLFPLSSLLKGDVNKMGDMKRPVEDAWKEFKSKGMKKDPRKKTSEIVLYRIDPPDKTDESEKERRLFMHAACEYLTKANEVKVKKGVELVQHLIEYYHAQYKYFNHGLELLESLKPYIEGLAGELQQLKAEKDDERRELNNIKNQLKTLYNLDSAKEGEKSKSYKIHGQQGDKFYGGEKAGNLMKRSEGVRKQWQRRYCVVKDGLFTLAHNQQSAPSTTLNLLTCQVRPCQDKDKKLTFGLVTHNRTYLFMAEDELDYDAWISVLSNAREDALNKAFGEGEGALSKEPVNSIVELTQGIIGEVKRLPGNNRCVDCNAEDPTWLSTNLGVLVCIECSGIHRELGVHVSRIRSLTLDRLVTAELLLARVVGNSDFNEIMELNMEPSSKPTSSSNMDVRKEFIQQKYVQKKFINKSGHSPAVLLEELKQAINYQDILAVLQLYADGVDFSAQLQDYASGGTALHYCVEKEDLTNLHIVDFIIQNSKNVNIQNTHGNTALHVAAMSNNTECSKLLIRANANLELVNKDGKNAQALAQEHKNKEVLELLQDKLDGRLGKFENVKIDWGMEESEDIYAVPIDPRDFKLSLKDELVEATNKKVGTPPGLATPGTITRSVTVPKGGLKTSGDPTPVTVPTSGNPNRHSVAAVNDFHLLPPQLLGKTALPSTNNNPPPPPPPARKVTTKIKGALPPVQSSPSQTTSIANATSPPTRDTMVHLGSSTASTLSTFAPKAATPAKSAALPPIDLSHLHSTTTAAGTTEKSGAAPPPAPPRTSSFVPKGVEPAAVLRPDRPPPPASVKRGHSRNQSTGNILFAGGNLPQTSSPHLRSRTSSVKDNTFHLQREPIPADPDAPPLPPPRPKQKGENADPVQKISPQTQPVQRKSSLPKRNEAPKQRYRRAEALYDCEADHDDELSFVEGDIIIMKHEAEADWWKQPASSFLENGN